MPVLEPPIAPPTVAAPEPPPTTEKRKPGRPRRVGHRIDERERTPPPRTLPLLRDDDRFLTERWRDDTTKEFRRLAKNTPNLLEEHAAPDVAPIDVLPWIVAIWQAVFGAVAAMLVKRHTLTPDQGAAFAPTTEEHDRLSKQTAAVVDHYFGLHLEHLPPWAALVLTVGAIGASCTQRALAVQAPQGKAA